MRKFLWSFFETFESVAIAAIAVFLIRSLVAQPFLVSGSSMSPTFQDGDYLLVDELTYKFREPQRGEVLVFAYPGDRSTYYIKRVIGLPNETVTIIDGKVEVRSNDENELVLKEPYVASNTTMSNMEVVLKDGQYFMMGDNRNFSFDSRSWGPLSKADIVGFARLRLWPIEKAMAFTAQAY